MKFRSSFTAGPSEIDGKGCFTSIDLEAGMCFPVPYHHIEENEADKHTLWMEEEGPLEIYGPFKFLNHQDDPNAEFEWHEDYGLMLRIIKYLEGGDEITIHYGDEW